MTSTYEATPPSADPFLYFVLLSQNIRPAIAACGEMGEVVGISEIHRKPIASKEDILDLLLELYGLKVAAISEQESYSDQVCHVVTREKEPLLTEEYILKLYNHEASENLKDITEVIDILVWLNLQGINCPKPLKNKHGTYITLKDFSKDENGITIFGTYAVCLFSFVKGVQLKKIVDISDGLLFNAGQYLAELQLLLKKVHFPITRRLEYNFDFDCIKERLREKYFYKFVDGVKRELILEAFHNFVTDVDQQKAQLEKGVIHGDYNEANILISSESVNGSLISERITGIIDFNDLIDGALVYDTAIGLLYMMLLRRGDMFTAGAHFLAGYQSKRPLQALEKEVIIKIVAARLALSLVAGLEASSKDPDNVYLLETQAVGWDFLQMLLNIPEKDIWETWNLIIDGYEKSQKIEA
ncbi:hydroxylysine kinase-like [Anneissia japonica]|uniref:hydroxylysine kinase-like n=1 Tax=Anneissia japonica TaxID=1529436 RepID=UPI0014258B53|nr:hydroxylysine kinase-like [Anneissia japonica]